MYCTNKNMCDMSGGWWQSSDRIQCPGNGLCPPGSTHANKGCGDLRTLGVRSCHHPSDGSCFLDCNDDTNVCGSMCDMSGGWWQSSDRIQCPGNGLCPTGSTHANKGCGDLRALGVRSCRHPSDGSCFLDCNGGSTPPAPPTPFPSGNCANVDFCNYLGQQGYILNSDMQNVQNCASECCCSNSSGCFSRAGGGFRKACMPTNKEIASETCNRGSWNSNAHDGLACTL